VSWFRVPADDGHVVMRVVFSVVLAWMVAMSVFMCDHLSAHAEGFTADDTIAAIDQASAETGVSWTWLYRVVACETGRTFNPYVIGRQGERGAAQLHPRGKLPQFYQLGYDDPYDPYQAVRFMAYRFAAGQAGAWSCR
jgi:soluble lytic murein transglycosylase-like protein